MSKADMILKTQELVKSYKKKKVVDRVSLEVKTGEIVGLLGPNGAGKTTTFYMITGLIKNDEGRIYLNDQDITHKPMYQRARLGIGYLPQETSVFRGLTVEENILAILELVEPEKNRRKERLQALLDKFQLSSLRRQKAYTLSGGERRRTEIARALVRSPHFLLLDEPFTGIDPIGVSELQKILEDLKQMGIGVLITDHRVRETLEITDRSYIIYEGKVLISGTAKELVDNPKAKQVYLGEKFKLQ
jgi:lipopolysaccharide export system ATP-binding protein